MNPVPFHCSLDRIDDGEHWATDWSGSAQLVSMSDTYPCEVLIRARGTQYHLVVGRYEFGYYVVLPLKDIGAGIAYPGDANWNTEHLIQTGVAPVDAYSIGAGLKALAPYLPEE